MAPKKSAPPPEPEKPVHAGPKERVMSFIKRFGTYGEDPGSFRYPTDAVVLPDNAVLVADSWNNRIQVLDLNLDSGDLEILDTYIFPGNMEPIGIAVYGPRIFITCHGYGSTPHGVQEFGWSGIDPSKPIIIEKKKIVPETKGKGKAQKGAAIPTPVLEPVIVPKSKLWPMNFYGNKIGSGNEEFAYPSCITMHKQSGCLLISDSGNFRMVMLKPGTKVGDPASWINSWTHDIDQEEGFNTAKGVAVDKNGFVYISDILTNKVLLYCYDKHKNNFIFLKVLIGGENNNTSTPLQGHSNGSGGDGTTTNDITHSNHRKDQINKQYSTPFPNHILDISNPWSIRVDEIYDPIIEAARASQANDPTGTSASGGGGGGGTNDSNSTQQTHILTLTDKSHKVHSFSIKIESKSGKDDSLVDGSIISGGDISGDDEHGGTDDGEEDDGDDDDGEDDILSRYNIEFQHISSYGPEMEGNGKVTLDTPTGSDIMRLKPSNGHLSSSNSIEGDSIGGNDNGGGEIQNMESFKRDEYVIVVDSHNHSLVALGVNITPN